MTDLQIKRLINGEKIHQLSRQSPLRLFSKIIILFLIVILCNTAMILYPFFSVTIFGIFFLGYLYVGLYVLAHELVHKRLTKNHIIDDVIGTILMAPMFVSFLEYRFGHKRHHNKSTTKLDPGFISKPNSRIFRGIIVLFHYLNIAYVMTPFFDLRYEVLEKGLFSALLGFIKSLWLAIVVIILFGWTIFLVHIIFPYLLFCFFNTLKNSAEHDYLYLGDEGDSIQWKTTRTISASRITRFFWSNCNYHKEHHLIQSIPYWNLPDFSLMLKSLIGDVPSMSYFDFFKMRLKQGVKYPFFV